MAVGKSDADPGNWFFPLPKAKTPAPSSQTSTPDHNSRCTDFQSLPTAE